jgi:hypothetical protein
LETKEQKRKKKEKNKKKWGVARDTSFIVRKREISVSLTVASQYLLVLLVQIEIRETKNKMWWKVNCLKKPV